MAYEDRYGAVRDRADVSATRARDASLTILQHAIPADRRSNAPRRRRNAFRELDCVRHRLPSYLIAEIEQRAAELDVGAERVLIAAGFMNEDSYVYALARSLGYEYETFDHRDRACCPLDDEQLLSAAKTGLIPLSIDNKPVFVVAPHAVRQFIDSVALLRNARFRLTTTARLNLFIADKGRAAVARRAAGFLRDERPQLCAGRAHWTFRAVFAILTLMLLMAIARFPQTMLIGLAATLAAVFLAALVLRLLGSYLPASRPPTGRIPDHELPVYTIIAALHNETKTAKELVGSLRDLDYPGIMAQTPQA